MLRYAIIGTGMMGQEHIRSLALIEGVQVVALMDVDAQMRAQAHALAPHARTFDDHKALLSADLADVYLIATPNDMHRHHFQDVLATGKPIMVEKPLAITSADCRFLMDRAAGYRAPIWVAMEYRYMPPIQTLLGAMANATAGTPRMIAIREHRFPFLHKVRNWNRFNARTGGTMVEKCCHFWDLMRLILKSDPTRVYASIGADVNHKDESHANGQTPDIADNGFVIVDFANGARGMLDICMFAEGAHWQESIWVTGEKARLEVLIPGPARFDPDGQAHHAEFAIASRASRREQRQVVDVPQAILEAGDHHGSTYFQHIQFRDLVQKGAGKPEVSLEDGYWSVLVGETAERSARSGCAINLEREGP